MSRFIADGDAEMALVSGASPPDAPLPKMDKKTAQLLGLKETEYELVETEEAGGVDD